MADSQHIKHGHARKGKYTPEYYAWSDAKGRCYRKTKWNYERYGGRGITMCERWLNSFANFLADMGLRPSPEHSLDRFPNNNGNYEPGNCRWATRKQQVRNRRSNQLVSFNGETHLLIEWSEMLGIPYKTLFARRRYGMPPELMFYRGDARSLRFLAKEKRAAVLSIAHN